MKLLLIAPFEPPYGGITNWTKIVVNGIAKNFPDIDLHYINTSPSKIVTEGRTLKNRVFDGIRTILTTFSYLVENFRNESPDVVHLTTSGSLAFFRDYLILRYISKKNIHSVYHLHFGRVPLILSSSNFEKKWLIKNLKKATSVIVMDQKSYEAIKVCIPNISVFKINNPVEELFIEKRSSSNYFMFLGWVIKSKGIEDLLYAWKKANLNSILRIVGPYNVLYVEYLIKNGYVADNVVFEGEKKHSEAMELLANCDVFILPSHSEGCPYVILEAMSLKKPIIGTNVGDIPSMLKDDCGIIISPNNWNEILDSILYINENPIRKSELGEKAYNKVVKEYSLNNILKLYRNIWELYYDII